ncbi:uncharacterized protein ARMOST_19490 [Armillaria ostoyae]|uniref:Uncharacterized protein n=1 Tax=Armillaria ostoyae TaxID=47428 RepID=A0A284S4T6_ARMOS|nr:uncharacterized protein ARMOST_19490 [Armillaria ostoyae]
MRVVHHLTIILKLEDAVVADRVGWRHRLFPRLPMFSPAPCLAEVKISRSWENGNFYLGIPEYAVAIFESRPPKQDNINTSEGATKDGAEGKDQALMFEESPCFPLVSEKLAMSCSQRA